MELVVYVPALAATTFEWEPLISHLRNDAKLRHVHWLNWDHHCGYASIRDFRRLAADLQNAIDEKWRTHSYTRLRLIGHSFGGLLVRQAYLHASGASGEEFPRSPWARAVERIVLLAAPNRGIDLTRKNSASPWFRAMRATRVVKLRGLARPFLMGDLLQGSAPIANLRIDWIRHFRNHGDDALPTVVQLRGAQDSVVAESDSLDLFQFPKAYTVGVPGATHRSIHQLPEQNPTRYRFLRGAIFEDLDPQDRASRRASPHDTIVFILHGIRTNAKTWAKELEDAIREMKPGVSVVTPPYGYVSALRFALPWVRRRQIGWFQDVYAEELGKAGPNAVFHFVGHSNGTYIFGRALERLRGMKFDNVVLTGCVLPDDYDWVERGDQVRRIRNHQATADVPVAMLCNALRGLGMRDVGTAGHRGFKTRKTDLVREVYYHPGGHSAALHRESLKTIAESVIKGHDATPPLANQEAVSEAFDRLSRFMRYMPAVLTMTAAATAVWWLIPPAWFWSTGGIALLVVAVLLVIALLLDIL